MCSNISHELVVKEVHGSGGYGMLVGPTSTKKERAEFAEKLKAKPGNYIAQPTLSLSTVPIMVKNGMAPRHVDLRPYVLVSDKVKIIPGGLTRVALKEGLTRRQFQPGRRHQRYMGTGGLMICSEELQTDSTGCSAISSALKISRGSSMPGCACR